MVTKLGLIQIGLLVLTLIFLFLSFTTVLFRQSPFPEILGFLIFVSGVIWILREFNLICPNCLRILSITNYSPRQIDFYSSVETEESEGTLHGRTVVKTYERRYDVSVYEQLHQCKHCGFSYTTKFKKRKYTGGNLLDINDPDDDY